MACRRLGLGIVRDTNHRCATQRCRQLGRGRYFSPEPSAGGKRRVATRDEDGWQRGRTRPAGRYEVDRWSPVLGHGATAKLVWHENNPSRRVEEACKAAAKKVPKTFRRRGAVGFSTARKRLRCALWGRGVEWAPAEVLSLAQIHPCNDCANDGDGDGDGKRRNCKGVAICKKGRSYGY